MACHTVNLPFNALDLRNPTSVIAKSGGHNKDSYPKWSVITYEFPANAHRPGITMTWYDGGQMPSDDILNVEKPSDSGSLIVGDRGKLYTPGDYGGGGRILGQSTIPEFPMYNRQATLRNSSGPLKAASRPQATSPITRAANRNYSPR